MPRMLRMPPKEQLPDGPHRQFVEELFMHYREAGRPTLREIARWIGHHQDSRHLRGTASTETIRRVLSGAVVPRTWLTVETILEALCGLADRSTDEERWPEDRWSSRTFKEELKQRWNAVLDHYEAEVPELPARSSPPPAPAPRSTTVDDPWATGPARGFGGSQEEPPF
jgi:hypothetical protein